MNQGSEFDRLEEFVGKLLTRYDQLLDKNSQLKKLLQQREDEIRELQEEVNVADSERGDISNRIKGLIDQIEEWQAVAESEEEPVEDEKEETAVEYQDDVRYEGNEDDREASLQRNLFHIERRGNDGSIE